MSALGLDHGNAICYSGYREGQSPHSRTFPSYEEIREDLQILAKNWQYLRLYDCSPHAETVLKVIRDEGLDFKIMLGLDMAAEMSNPHCPWGAEYSDDTLDANRMAHFLQAPPCDICLVYALIPEISVSCVPEPVPFVVKSV